MCASLSNGLDCQMDGPTWQYCSLRSAPCKADIDVSHSPIELLTPHGSLLLRDVRLLHLISGISLDEQDEAFDEMLLLACACIDSEIKALLGGVIVPKRLRGDVENLGPYVPAIFTLVGNSDVQDQYSFVISIHESVLAAWLKNEKWQTQARQKWQLPLEMVCSAELEIGAIEMPFQTLKSLQVGDALYLPEGGGQVGRLRWGFLQSEVVAGEDKRVMVHGLRKVSMTQQTLTTDDSALLSELPVTVIFSAGKLDLSLGQLQQLAVGDALELHRQTSANVEIFVNGMHLGEGELVDVDGRLAVEILSLRAQ